MDELVKDLYNFSLYLKNEGEKQGANATNYLKTSIHKSYYSVYHASKKLVEMIPEPDATKYKGGSHAKVIAALEQVEISSTRNLKKPWRDMKSLAKLLQNTRDLRHRVDYDLALSNIDSRELDVHFKYIDRALKLIDDITNSMNNKTQTNISNDVG